MAAAGKRVVMAAAEAERRSDLAAIHVAKRALGWSDDEYRDILLMVCHVKSAGDLDAAGRKRFLTHLKSCGFSRHVPARKTVRGQLTSAQRKMFALWQQLADAGMVRDRRMSALAAWVKQHQVGIDSIEWMKPAQEAMVIESLKRWLARSKTGGA